MKITKQQLKVLIDREIKKQVTIKELEDVELIGQLGQSLAETEYELLVIKQFLEEKGLYEEFKQRREQVKH